MTDEDIEKIIKANMSLQMNLAGIRQDFEEKTKREWVDLTEDEVTEIIEKFYPRSYGMDAVVIAAQTKLRNKNT